MRDVGFFCMGALAVVVLVAAGAACGLVEEPAGEPGAGAAFEPEIPQIPAMPLGLDEEMLEVPDDNPITPRKVALGWQLYYDPRLSADGSVSCASCHDPDHGFADPSAVSTGVGGETGTRNSPPVFNAAFNRHQFWDGRAASLEEQALGPMQNPVEMAHTLEGIEARLKRIPGYRQQFETVFGSPEVTADGVAKAIASFERVVLAGNSAWDRWYWRREEAAISAAAQRGYELFRGKAGCAQCHVGSLFTDAPYGLYHNLGVGMDADDPDLGRYAVTGAEEDRGAFKTPSLRNVARTAPYMHDGSIETLEEVVELYDRGGETNPWLSPKIRPLNLTDGEKADLLAFMESLACQVPAWSRRQPPLPPGVDEPGS